MKIIGLALIATAFAIAGAWAYSEIAAADGNLDSSGRRIDCIPRDHANPSGACLWTPELTKVEVKVEFEYPYCEVKLEVESNLDELPAGVSVGVANNYYYDSSIGSFTIEGTRAALIYIQSDDTRRPLASTRRPGSYSDWIGIGHTDNAEVVAHHPDWKMKTIQSTFRYKSNQTDWFRTLTDRVVRNLPQTTLGSVYMKVYFEYSGEFAKPKRIGGAVKTHGEVSPEFVRTNTIPLSPTFAGLFDEMTTCLEVAKREEERVSERVELQAQKAGLRQSLTLLESELARARKHELDATTILKEVIDVSAKVDEMLRTIQLVRVKGLEERRKIIERYYSEESHRYSVFIRSLESSKAALAAADEAIAAHKAELERSRQSLEALVSSAQAAEDELIAEIEEAREALGDDD